MRRHGLAAKRREAAASAALVRKMGEDLDRAELICQHVSKAMWAMRTLREVRAGAEYVAGPMGEVFKVNSVGLDGYDADLKDSGCELRLELRMRYGLRWTWADLLDAVKREPGIKPFVRTDPTMLLFCGRNP